VSHQSVVVVEEAMEVVVAEVEDSVEVVDLEVAVVEIQKRAKPQETL
jgi:chaperonin cofactor prefoldin